MDKDGGNCHPTIQDLVALSGLSKKTVIKHLDAAASAGWISVTRGQFYGQMHNRKSYVARFPDRPSVPVRQHDDDAESLGGGIASEGAKVVEMGDEDGVNKGNNTVYQLPHDNESPEDSPNISPQLRTRTGASGAERRKSERLFLRWLKAWPNAEQWSLSRTRKAWDDLDSDQRLRCIDRTPDYLNQPGTADRIACPATYLQARAWERLPPVVAPERPERVSAKAFGKVWMAYRFWLLLQPPNGQLVITGFDQRQIDQGQVTREALLFEKTRKSGWPAVNELLTKIREPVMCPSWLVEVSEGFRQVQRGSDLWSAWERLHERRGWPWFGWTTDYPWFPAVDPSAGDLNAAVDTAMNDFETLVNEGREDAG
ncbi:hypothetical protein GGQ72_004607 [Rhizobium rhizoryzae]|uniref:Helix-turn-helix domain-containing protein n=2 Tax=Rhizobium rhizoryzae TaxID=451876 RepID=A0A7W6PSY7_9HYPH|nr:hypothetical protein [Rhizobium rhizoryzae]